jgi:hypothetical protein
MEARVEMVNYKKKALILQCTNCKDVIQSQYRRHFTACHCGEVFTDGGDDYARYGSNPGFDFVILKEFGVQLEEVD